MKPHTHESERAALTERAVSRIYGVSRLRLKQARQAGELEAIRLGSKRLLYLRTDLEKWLKSYAIRPSSRAQALVEARLAREAGASVAP